MTIGCNSQGSETAVGFCTFVLWSISAGCNSTLGCFKRSEDTYKSAANLHKPINLFICVYRKARIYCLFKFLCMLTKSQTHNIHDVTH